jgi:streptogramin lyase
MVPMAGALGAAVPGTSVTYTSSADFDKGTLQDVNHGTADQLQLNRTQTFFPYVNIAASARGTMVRIDVNTGKILGEWQSAPNGRGQDPSRTTVDKFGNTWLSNRAEADGGKGSVTRIGVLQGGTRVNADGTANPDGDYLAPPFGYNTCVDRNHDGLIATSRGLGDIRPWTNDGGVDNDGGVSTAADECIITYTRVTGTNTRTVAVDANNDLWTGGSNTAHEKISGIDGAPIAGTQINLGCGGYGGLIDKAGTLWSARFGNNLLRYEPGTNSGQCLGTDHGDYGLGMDPNTGEIWHTTLWGNRVYKLAQNGTVLGAYEHGWDNAQGVAVDAKGNVWVAHSLFGSTTVGHLRTDGTFVGNVDLPGGNSPTGVAVDSNGKVWVANMNTQNAMRIDPDAGDAGGGGFKIGAVDLTVDLGAGANPYNYSDMTGSVLGKITAPQGIWSAVQDSGTAGSAWTKVAWNTEPQGSVPAGTSIVVETRIADTEAGLPAIAFTPVANGAAPSATGRFIEVRVTLKAASNGDSPVLSDLRVDGAAPAPTGRSVTGGGWITSPKGAYPKNPKATGKANLGFQAKYDKGGAASGTTEFQFKAADLNFCSPPRRTRVMAPRRDDLGPVAGFGGRPVVCDAMVSMS